MTVRIYAIYCRDTSKLGRRVSSSVCLFRVMCNDGSARTSDDSCQDCTSVTHDVDVRERDKQVFALRVRDHPTHRQTSAGVSLGL